MPYKLFPVGAVAVVIAYATPAHAQDGPFPQEDEIIVTGLRPVARGDVSASVTGLTSEDLLVRDTVYLADQLRAVPGLGISRSGASGGLTQVRIRGAKANHTLVLLNGVEISDPVTGETDFGLWAGVDATRIEILRGEQSALYGSDAVGGVINIIPNDAAGATGLIELGSRETCRLNGRYGVNTQKAQMAIGFAGFTTQGVDTSGQNGEADGTDAYSMIANGTRALNENWSAKGLLRYSIDEVKSDADSDFDGRLDDTDRLTKSTQWNLGGALQGDAYGLNHIFRAGFSQVKRKNFTDQIFSDATTGKRTKLSYSPSRKFETGATRFIFSGLLDYEKEDYERISTNTFFGDPNQSQSFETIGLAGEVQFSIKALSLNASLRHDDNDGRFDDANTWHIGTAYSLSETTRLRANAGTGVKNPTFTELFGFFPGSFRGNPNLQPERSTSFEFGVDQTIGPVELSATYFQAELEDEIITLFNPDFTSSPANLSGKSDRYGLEIAATWQASETLAIAASFSDITSENDTGQREIRVPEQTGSVSFNWHSLLTEGFTANFAVDYVGAQDDFFFTFPAQRITLDSYSLVSASLTYPLNKNLSLTLRGQNVLDEEIVDVFGFNQPGAGFYVGLRVR